MSEDEYEDELIIKETFQGKYKSPVRNLDFPDPFRVKESHGEVGKPDLEFPLEREYLGLTVEKYSLVNGRTSTVESDIKRFTVRLERTPDTEPDVERIRDTFDRIRELRALEAQISEANDYEDLLDMVEEVKGFEKRYNMMEKVWEYNCLPEYVTSNVSATMFEIKQYPQGFYLVPMLNNRHVCRLVGKHLESEDMGAYSVMWGGFVIEPGNFSQVHERLEPFYETP